MTFRRETERQAQDMRLPFLFALLYHGKNGRNYDKKEHIKFLRLSI
jgi:hypothetical protein